MIPDDGRELLERAVEVSQQFHGDYGIAPMQMGRITDVVAKRCQKSFSAFRRTIRPGMMWGPFVSDLTIELYEFYKKMVAGERPKLAISVGPQHGKLMSDDTPVLTMGGWKRHGELQIGDLIFHPSGLATRIIAVSSKEVADHRVELTDGSVFYCHARHEWTVYNCRKHRWETVETQQMLRRPRSGSNPLYSGVEGRRGCEYIFRLPLVAPLLGEERQLPVDPYVLGVWLGDGTSTAASITYADKDRRIVSAVVDCGYDEGATWEQPKGSGVLRTHFYKLLPQLRSAGVFAEGYRIRKKHIPESYLTASLHQRLELLAGLVDTDGYIYRQNGRVVFVTGDKLLADTFCHLIATFGWRVSVDTVAPSLSSSGVQGRSNCYYIGFQPTIAIPCRLERKQIHVGATRRRISIKSITVDLECNKVGHCITVDAPDGMYLVGETLQPTHNSWVAEDFIAWLAGLNPDLKTIYASYSDSLGVMRNLNLQRLIMSDRYRQIFPGTVIGVDGWQRNTSHFEYVERVGSFRNTTVHGQINGMEQHLGVIDDYAKGRAEANSKVERDKTWGWFADDFMPRMNKDSALLIVACLTGDMPVSMADGGWKPLCDVKVGDEVISWKDGESVAGRVTGFFPQGEDEVFEVRTEGSLVKGNARHPFKVMREDETFEWVRIDDLQVGDMIVQVANIGTGTDEGFTDDEAWALGFMFGDGWTTERLRRKLSGVDRWGNQSDQEITVDPNDKKAVRRAAHRKAAMKYSRKIGKNPRQNNPGLDYVTCVADKVPNWPDRATRAVNILEKKFDCKFKQTKFGYWRCDQQKLGRWLHGLGLGAGAKGKRVPKYIFRQAAHIRDAFLSGFAAADGSLRESIGDQDHHWASGGYSVQSVALANRLLIDDLRHLARTLGYRVTNIFEQRGWKRPPNSPHPVMSYVASFHYHWRIKNSVKFILSRVKSVTPCGRAEVFDITIENEHNFLVDGLCCRNTRWHIEDLIGRLVKKFPEMRQVTYQTIAEKDDHFRKEGEALFEELKPLKMMLDQKRLMTEASWEAEYQGRPFLTGSGDIPIEKLRILPFFRREDIAECVMSVDKAGTEGGDGAYTAIVIMDRMKDGTFVIEEVVRGHWAALARERIIKVCADAVRDRLARYGVSFKVIVEQEPGSGGKESAEATIRNLAGHICIADKPGRERSKEVRAEPFCAMVQGDNVRLHAGPWVEAYLEECGNWPASPIKDQVDASSQAFYWLTGGQRGYSMEVYAAVNA